MKHRIVACARGWIGTRFQHQGRVKKSAAHKGGVDCLGLLVGVAQELSLRSVDGALLFLCDETNYAHYPDTTHLRKRLSELLLPIAIHDILPGDVMLFRIADSPQHVGLASDNGESLGIIHAYAQARAVVEHALDDWWRERIEAAFRIHP